MLKTRITFGILIDFSKAFDSISHDYIYESLKKFNFGDYFIKIVKTMLTGRTCTVMVDGYETNPFRIERGVPQGDTASPYLFILVLEILLLRIMIVTHGTPLHRHIWGSHHLLKERVTYPPPFLPQEEVQCWELIIWEI